MSRPSEGARKPSDRKHSKGPSESALRPVKSDRRGRRKRAETPPARGWWIIALLVIGAFVAVFGTYLLVIFPGTKGPGTGKDVELAFEADEAASSVVAKLAGGGLLRSPRTFGLYLRFVGVHPAAGTHLLTDDASPSELVRRLERNGAASHAKVTIPEGWNRFDIAKRLQNLHVAWSASFLEATVNADFLRELSIEGESAEGYLFPATYDLPLDSDPKDVVHRLVDQFDRRYGQLEHNHGAGRSALEQSLGWTRREIVTLASMIEKEAAVDEERPIVASVFLNRLRDPNFKRKVLQCDPTAGYGCLALRDRVPACAGYAGKVTHAINMDSANTYSTYVHEGLPPGPIANPGAKSLQAVLDPANTKYLYFVVRGDRHHAFSETLEEHNTAVKEYRERTRER